MKLPLKYIVISVIVALVCIFAYQAYWLVGLYHAQRQEMDERVTEAMKYAHVMEMEKRVEKLRNDENGPHGQLETNVGFSMEEEDDDEDEAPVQVKKVKGGRTITETRVVPSSEKSSGSSAPSNDQKQTLMLMMSGKLTTLFQQAMFSKLNEISQLDIQTYDTLLTKKLVADSLGMGKPTIPHRIQFCQGKKVLSQFTSKGYVPSSEAKRYQYVVCNEGEPNEEKYVLTIEPMTMAVLGQMAGILATSFFIMLILGFAFWYLIHTMLKQKTLDEMKSDFTNNITHELKTPIAVAYAANDALLNYGMMRNPDKARKYLGIAQEQLQQLSGMVEQILSMSMERRKTMLLNIVDVPVREVITPLILQHQLKASKKVDISLSVEPENLMVRADRMHFSNIVSNLIDNAIKYSGDEVKIEIKASVLASSRNNSDGKEVVLTITDDGIGIAHDKLPYIFDKFYRVTDGNKYTVKGYGLGLFYVKSLMEKMSGTVSVESEFGKGSKFELRFKL